MEELLTGGRGFGLRVARQNQLTRRVCKLGIAVTNERAVFFFFFPISKMKRFIIVSQLDHGGGSWTECILLRRQKNNRNLSRRCSRSVILHNRVSPDPLHE